MFKYFNSLPNDRRSDTGSRLTIVFVLTLIVAGSFFLNITNNDFPHFYHGDESNKIEYVLEGGSNYKHPVLMLLVNRVFRVLQPSKDVQKNLTLARTVSAFFGALLTLVSFFVGRRLLGAIRALFLAGAVAVAPSVVIHAHYLKEDIYVAPFCILSLYCYIRTVNHTSRRNVALLGIATGLAMASKYIGALLIPIYLIAPFGCSLQNKKALLKWILVSVAISLLTFSLVNLEIFFNLNDFFGGLQYEARHVVTGHRLRISPIDHLFAYHLLKSIVPGITWFLLAPALASILHLSFTWKTARWEEKLLLLYILVFYLTIEISPSKPFNGAMRYVIPILPVICFFSIKGIWQLSTLIPGLKRDLTFALLTCCFLVYPIYDTANLLYYLNRDTRDQLSKWLKRTGGKAIMEQYTGEENIGPLYEYLKRKRIESDTKYIVTSSFYYGRYLYAGHLSDQKPGVYRRYHFYKELLKHTHKSFEPAYKTFALSNPTVNVIRVQDLIDDGFFEREGMKLKGLKWHKGLGKNK